MPDITYLIEFCNKIVIDFVGRVAISRTVLNSRSNFICRDYHFPTLFPVHESLGIDRARSTVHNWVQKADLEPEGGRNQDKIVLDETVENVEEERFWLYSTGDVETNQILHIKLYYSRNKALTKMFLRELAEKHDIEKLRMLRGWSALAPSWIPRIRHALSA